MNAAQDTVTQSTVTPNTVNPGRPRRFNTLRFQFTLVVFLLAFTPNAVLTLGAGRELGLLGGAALPLALWLATVAALSALMGWILSGALLRPLSRLTGELARGEFNPSLPGDAARLSEDPQEVKALRRAFSGLLDRLGTEQGRRSAFMATLVHDLKTPLVATGHLIRTLSSRPLPDLERSALGEHLLNENARLLGLVQQMADAHRFEREDVSITSAATDLRALLERVAARAVQGRTAPGVQVLISGSGEAAVDASVLERAVANLADNALRYARTRLELRVGPEGLSVCDDGPGLAEGATIDTLAQPFNAQPVEIAGQHYTAGTAGLGLYIVRRIAEAHGGDLTCRREQHPAGPPMTVMQLHLPQVYTPVSPDAAGLPGTPPPTSLSFAATYLPMPTATPTLEVHP